MGKAIGVDLGTTNTAVAVLVDGRPRVLEDEKGYKVLPSCVAFKGDGKRVVGQTARNLIITQPENTAYAIKRLMGRRYDSPEVAEVKKLVSYHIAQADDGMCKVRVGDDWYTPVEISAVILQVAREMAERSLGDTVDEAVITVPAYFNHAQRSATFDAARLAGLRCERLLNEPTAAALAYGYRKDIERRIVVYDLGGGTFDVSVLQLARGIYEVLATSGETHLGGEDFDQRIVDQLSEDFLAKTGVDPRTDSTALQRLKDAAERAKCELSFTDRTTILIPMITMADSLETSLSRLALEGLVGDLVDRTLEITRDAIKSAGLRLADIDDVILVGGQTRMPRVREAIRSLFQKEPSRSVHPEEVVAIGAAVHATSLTSLEAHKPLLLDVTPFDLGIDVAGGLFKKIITANSQVPASFTESFATVKDNQKQVRVTVRQGGAPIATENEFLGEFVMAGLTQAPRMETKVEVTFKIDTNGMLHVTATEAGSGDRKRITIRNYAEFVQGEGIAPDLEGDLGGPEVDDDEEAGGTTGGRTSGGSDAPPSGFLRRLFGRRKPGPTPASADVPADPAEPSAESTAGDVPEMPSFLQELGDADLMSLEPVDDYEVPGGLDAVGGGLDALGIGDLAPLSSADLAPLTPPPLAGGGATDAGPAELDTDAIFALPDSDDEYFDDEDDGDDAMYADEEDLDGGALSDGFVSYADEDDYSDNQAVFVDDDDDDDELAGEAVFVDDDEEDAEPGVFADEHDYDEDSEAAVFVEEDDDPGEGVFLDLGDDDPTEAVASSELFAHGVTNTEDTEPAPDGLFDDEDFEVDDSTRSLVQPIAAAPSVPLPVMEVEEEKLWEEDELPDDGTIEFTRDGATSTPRVFQFDDEEDGYGGLQETPTLTDHTPSAAVDPSEPVVDDGFDWAPPEDQTLVDAQPVDFDDVPTDPPMATDGGSRRLRLDYPSAQRLAEDLVTGLRRGGCFVSTDTPLPEGVECVLEFGSPGLDTEVVLEAVVTWSTYRPEGGQGGHTPGMDVEFQTGRADRKRLIQELEALR